MSELENLDSFGEVCGTCSSLISMYSIDVRYVNNLWIKVDLMLLKEDNVYWNGRCSTALKCCFRERSSCRIPAVSADNLQIRGIKWKTWSSWVTTRRQRISFYVEIF